MLFPRQCRAIIRRIPKPFLSARHEQSLSANILNSKSFIWSSSLPPTRRKFHSCKRCNQETVPITFIDTQGNEEEVNAEIGKNLLDVAQENDIDLEGACGGELACATCHLVFEKDIFETLPEKEDEEDDMLDLAFELTETSRLGCQIKVRQDFAGMKVRIPDDGY